MGGDVHERSTFSHFSNYLFHRFEFFIWHKKINLNFKILWIKIEKFGRNTSKFLQTTNFAVLFQEYQDLTAKLHELKLMEQSFIEKIQHIELSEKENSSEVSFLTKI